MTMNHADPNFVFDAYDRLMANDTEAVEAVLGAARRYEDGEGHEHLREALDALYEQFCERLDAKPGAA